MPETILLVVGLALAAAAVLVPLRRAGASEPADVVDAAPDDAARIRHRAALEALRDVDADRRAGSLDDAAYASALAEAEARAAETRGAGRTPRSR